ncbi:hypothetical protein [Methylocapsa aurea]|uniref:hypothetical protein n=1 Tax=Methylocapsa aurea TaxID=663610 RepID=UPI003D18B141
MICLRASPEAYAPAADDASDVRDCAVADDRIEIEIADARVFVPPGADVETLRKVVAALRSTR